MRKSIAAVVAAGAMAAAGAASAQDFGTVISSLFGLGPTYGTSYNYGQQVYQDQFGRRFYYDQYGRQVYLQGSYGYGTLGTPSQPAIVAGTQNVYTDQYGRRFHYDQYGRQVFQSGNSQIVGYDTWGRPIYGSVGTYAYGGRAWDRDGDGVANTRDRWPDDSRYR